MEMKRTNQSIKFINLIRETPVLYDKTCVGYESHDNKHRLWDSIATEVGFPSGEKAKQRWRAIRDRYVRERRKLYSSPLGISEEHVWPLMKHLTFLDGHIQPSRTRTWRPNENETIILDDHENETNETNLIAEPCFVDCSLTNAKSDDDDDDDDASIVSVPPESKMSLEEAVTAVGQYFYEQANDIDAAFCQYVLTEMKQMSDHVKARFKKMILNYICAHTNNKSEH